MADQGGGSRETFVVGRMDRKTQDVRIVPEWAPLRGPWKIRAVVRESAPARSARRRADTEFRAAEISDSTRP